MNVILCGLPFSGKSTFGKALAKALDWDFCDTDQVLEERHQQSCREIFRNYGENYFRELEHQVIVSLVNLKKTVIATGGGSLLRENNRALLKQVGVLLYLKVGLDEILGRLEKLEEKPAYLNLEDWKGSYRRLADERMQLYEEHCDLIWERGS